MKVHKLQKRHKSNLKKFLSELDKATTHDYTHFGYSLDPAKASKSVFRELKKKELRGYVLVEGQRIIGFGHLNFFSVKQKRHVVRLGIVLHPVYQGKGLGKILLDYMISDANRLGKEKIWLATYSDNPRALELYRGRGFTIEGVFRKEEKVNGKYRDVLSLALFLNRRKK